MAELSAPDDRGVRRLTFRRLDEVPAVLKQLTALAEAVGYGSRAVFGLRLSLEEVLTNAVRHGNKGDADKVVRVEANVNGAEASYAIEDEGAGFVPADLPDPTDPEYLLRPCGRGVMLMHAYMTEVRYNDRGNRVTLVKRKDCPRPVLDEE